jgi:hypothetical protein
LPSAQLRSYSVVVLIRTILVFSTLVVALTFPFFGEHLLHLMLIGFEVFSCLLSSSFVNWTAAFVMALIGSLFAMLIVSSLFISIYTSVVILQSYRYEEL